MTQLSCAQTQRRKLPTLSHSKLERKLRRKALAISKARNSCVTCVAPMNDCSSALREGEKNKPARSAQPIRTKFSTNMCCAALAEFVFSSMNYGSTIDRRRQLDNEAETRSHQSNAPPTYDLSIGRDRTGVNTQLISNGKSSGPPMSVFKSVVILLKSVVAVL